MDKAKLKRVLVGEWSWWRLARSLLFVYTCVALYVFFTADRQIFLPPPASYNDNTEILKLIFAAAPEPKLALWVETAGHNDLVEVAESRYREALQELARLLGS